MRDDFQRWPSTVLIDGTYKLTNSKLTLMLLVVEDSKGRGQIAGVGLLATEECDILQWMIQAFKRENGENHCRKINCFMSDKDLLERNVLREEFPGTPIYICRFHVLKTFKKVVNSVQMKLNENKKKTILRILEKLTYARSEEHYDTLYDLLQNNSPPQLIDYYDVNWHNIKEE